jgi:predicted nucleic acid-binding protein
VSRFVLDASIVLAWCFPDENSSLAQHVANLFKRGDTAVAPSFWPHEVLNALLAGEKRKRISESLVRSFLDDLSSLPVVLQEVPSAIVFDRVQQSTRKYGLTAYDAAYFDLAEHSGLHLATLDEDLTKACRKARVRLIEP